VPPLAPLTLLLSCVALGVAPQQTPVTEDGYDLWLRYRLIDDAARLTEYRGAITHLVVNPGTPTINAARAELVAGLG
jgi:alpha-glucuronidase